MTKVKPAQIRMYVEVSVKEAVPPPEMALALLARADNEIDLRIRTPLVSQESLEQYARDFGEAAGRVLLAVRQADWHKPLICPESPYGLFTTKGLIWSLKQDDDRIRNPRIKIVEPSLSEAITQAEVDINRRRFGEPRPQRPGARQPIYQRRQIWVEQIMWVARELSGVAEITFLPTQRIDPDAYPITATFGTAHSVEDIRKALQFFVNGKQPFEVASLTTNELAKERGVTALPEIWAHIDRRQHLYVQVWKRICDLRGYGDPHGQIRACVCRTEYPKPPRNQDEVFEQFFQHMVDRKPHLPICYERLLDLLTYWPDWWLARNNFANEVGERHSLILHYKRLLSKARRYGRA